MLVMDWNAFVAWYDARPSYTATDALVAVDRELIRIASAGPDNWHLFAEHAAQLVAQYDAMTRKVGA